MMKYFMYLIFLMPLCFNNMFWLYQFWLFVFVVGFIFMYNYNWFFSFLGYSLGCDYLSFFLILLSIWICLLMIMSSEKIFYLDYFSSFFVVVINFLMIILYFTFSSLNLFIFYLFFEISLIPTLILILGWGYQPERLQAGVYMLFYTFFASLPMITSIFFLYKSIGSLDFCYLFGNYGGLVFICMCFVFLIKFPMFFVHLWLPKAHVEAPVSGSMILAGVMLKLGGYGLMRVLLLFTEILLKINNYLIVFVLFGGCLCSFVCLRQVDIKSLIAYSSVCHMSLVLSGILTLSCLGFIGSLMLMIGHGLCSSGLFCLANMVYERFFTRSFFLVKGMVNIFPSLSFFFFCFCACNISCPPSLSLFGEIILISCLIGWSSMFFMFIGIISFFSACYSLYLYSYTQHGKVSSCVVSTFNSYVREYFLLVLHLFPLNSIILIWSSIMY